MRGRLHSMLAALAKLQSASGASAAAKDTALLAKLAQAGNLVSRIEQVDVIGHFVGELKASHGDKARFDQTLNEMRKPGLLTDVEVKAIARHYLETKATFKTKAAAIEAIRDARARDDRLPGKLAAS
ncbi:MAG: hypothetical protein JNJ73_15790 [Hyphomonadaceae bacterium]|nr:hypothetical protein [Hyphomonadaceae bacterium]